ncbi:MAG: hypothetical protein M1832_001362, partial [Thelocarpon impressellum]
VRKSSTAGGGATGPGSGPAVGRPRAATISHVDGATLGMIAAANASAVRNGPPGPGTGTGPGHASGHGHGHGQGHGHGHHASLSGLPGPSGYGFRGMSGAVGHHGNAHGLPKLDTNGPSSLDLGGGLRTAPPVAGFHSGFDIDGLLFGGPGSTVNPAQLHFSDSPQSFAVGTPTPPYGHVFPGLPTNQSLLEDEENFDWMTGFDGQLSLLGSNDQAVDESSPSAISTASQSGISEVMLDGSNNPAHGAAAMWPHASMMPPAHVAPAPFAMDLAGSAFAEMVTPPGTVSPKSLHGQAGSSEHYFSTPPPPPSSAFPGLPGPLVHPPMAFHPDTPSTSSASVSGSARQSSVTSVSTESITDATRQALLASLSQPSHFSHPQRKYSAASAHVPPSPALASKFGGVSVSLPSTRDLQRYVAAYVQHFHPHLPFLHLATLSFDAPAFTQPERGQAAFRSGGGGGLILAMAAIGALYEFEPGPSKDLFDSSKRMIQIYLEERRKADVSAAHAAPGPAPDVPQTTPLWLVQAMLLNVVYGINCGDKTSGDIANTHITALVSLARAAALGQPSPQHHATYPAGMFGAGEDVHMDDGMPASDPWQFGGDADTPDDRLEWLGWKVAEERKRTLYAIFILSSLLVAAYNHAPALTNSEILLDLPCDEDLWAAESARAWRTLGGAAAAEQRAMTFPAALGSLLSASQRQGAARGAQQEPVPVSDLRPSTFGCLILIDALHNYIWETRQRHHSRQWTTQETEAMHAHIEPALKAWQAAWASDPHHSLERPNPYGRSPLSADSVPLLDLAYVRLFVNLGRSKEAFWQRDYDAMAEELARGSEIVQHADHTSRSRAASYASDHRGSVGSRTGGSPHYPGPDGGNPTQDGEAEQNDPSAHSSRRERHLRKAAFYAADSLSVSDRLGLTFADNTSRELPLQSAMCAFDCAQVLAEWVSTVQERVGRYLGVIGRDEIEFGQVPCIMLLEDEDCKLLEKIADVIGSAEAKTSFEYHGLGLSLMGLQAEGYGSKILRVTAAMLDRGGVWGVTHLMARALETQALHMKARAENSIMKHE